MPTGRFELPSPAYETGAPPVEPCRRFGTAHGTRTRTARVEASHAAVTSEPRIRETGIEPVTPAWDAGVSPQHFTRKSCGGQGSRTLRPLARSPAAGGHLAADAGRTLQTDKYKNRRERKGQESNLQGRWARPLSRRMPSPIGLPFQAYEDEFTWAGWESNPRRNGLKARCKANVCYQPDW